jgi:RecB family exonuclease
VTLRAVWTPYGEPALALLRHHIDSIKGDDPLHPVTVVVARGQVGLGIRRALAGGVSGTGQPGIAAVRVDTLDALADTLAGGDLAAAGRRPLTDAVLREAVRAALRDTRTPLLGPAGGHASTIDALVTTYRELRTAEQPALDRLAGQSARAAEVVAVLRAAHDRVGDWYDKVDVLEAATARLAHSGAGAGQLGEVVAFLPQALIPPAVAFVRALAGHLPCTVLVGHTGDREVDEDTQRMVEALRPDEAQPRTDEARVRVGDAVLSAPTVDAELLLVVRDLMTRAEAGTPLERMAIVHAGSPQYVSMVQTMLREAGIPYNGSGVRPLSATVPGRILLGALALPEHDWRREDVAAWLNTGPIRHEGHTIAAVRWDMLSGEAGVQGGLDDWRVCLNARALALRAEASRGNPDLDDDEVWRQIRTEEAARCDALLAFVEEMANRLVCPATTWRAWADWGKALLGALIGTAPVFEHWPVDERAAAEQVLEVIDHLGVLDGVASEFSTPAALAALESELAVPAPQTTRFGSGVWVVNLEAAAGLTYDALYVVGVNDGHFPRRPSDDVLIPDRERSEHPAASGVPLRGARAVATRHAYLAALAGSQYSQLSFARGNQRDGRELRPSRWALDAIERVVDWPERLYHSDLVKVPPTAAYRFEASYITAVLSTAAPVSLGDRDTRSLLSWRSVGRSLGDHPLCRDDRQLARGAATVSGRRSFSRFNGNLGAAGSGLVPPVLSATRLEKFAQCPRRYFFEEILKVTPRPVSERLMAVDRMAYGSLVHRILERFIGGQIGWLPGDRPEDPFSDDRLMVIAGEALAQFEADGLAGPRAAWAVERTRLLRELRSFAATDRERRATSGNRPIGVEQAFGQDGVEPVLVQVPGHVPVRFRGKIDRVDRGPQGAHVIDYKTGGPDRYKKIDQEPFGRGDAVQLPIYALAVGATADAPVRADYWCVNERGSFTPFGFEVGRTEIEELGRIVGIHTETMAAGHFPANPGPSELERGGPCTYCPYDSVCPPDRAQVWDRVRQDRGLVDYVTLVDPP